MFRELIQGGIKPLVDTYNPLYVLRKEFCGAMFNQDKLEKRRRGFSRHEREDGRDAFLFFQSHSEEEWLLDIVFQDDGKLMDLACVPFDADVGLFVDNSNSFPFEKKVRKALRKCRVAPVPPEEDVVFDEVALEIVPLGNYDVLSRMYGDHFSSVSRSLIGFLRQPHSGNFPEVYASAAMIAFDSLMHHEAILLLNRALDTNEDSERYWHYIGCTLRHLGFAESAVVADLAACGIKESDPILDMPFIPTQMSFYRSFQDESELP